MIDIAAKVISAAKRIGGSPLLSTAKRYWPGMGKYGERSKVPEVSLVPRAAACLEVALARSERNLDLYNELVEAFRSDEFVPIWRTTIKNIQHDRRAARKVVRAPLVMATGRMLTDPQRVIMLNALFNMMGNPNNMPPGIVEAAEKFVLHAFNRPEEIHRPRVLLDPSTPLTQVVLLRAVLNARGIDLDAIDKANPKKLTHLIGKKPSKSLDRVQKPKLIAGFHYQGFGLVADETCLNESDMWYTGRVDPGKFAAVLNEYHQFDNPKLNHIFDPYDDACGYRKKREYHNYWNNHDWLKRNLDKLRHEYQGCFVIILDRKVIAHDGDFDTITATLRDLSDRAREAYVKYVSPQKERSPSPSEIEVPTFTSNT